MNASKNYFDASKKYFEKFKKLVDFLQICEIIEICIRMCITVYMDLRVVIH